MAKITLKGNLINTNGELPSIGSKAPDFVLVDQDLNDKTLLDFKGKKKILSLVPSLDTSVCATSTKKFNEHASKISNTVILVISADLPFAQKRFCSSEDIKNLQTLSMMRSKDFAKDYGVLISDGPLNGLIARSIVILDMDDKVIYTELVPEIASEPNYEKAINALA